MQIDSYLKSYNHFLISSLKSNKFTVLFFSLVTTLGYLSLPYLEKYQKNIKNKSNQKNKKIRMKIKK